MKILFLGDVVGISGRSMVLNNLLSKIKDEKIDFVVVNGENAADSGVGLTEEICKDFFNCGVDVITTGNHVWDQKKQCLILKKKIDFLDLKIYLNHLQEKALEYLLLKMK